MKEYTGNKLRDTIYHYIEANKVVKKKIYH